MFTFKPHLTYRLSLEDIQVSDVFWMIMRYVSDPDVIDAMDGYADYRNLCDVRTYAFYQFRLTEVCGVDMVIVDFGQNENGYQYTAEVQIKTINNDTDYINVKIVGHDTANAEKPDRDVLLFELSDTDDEYDDILFEVVDYSTYRDGGPLVKFSEDTYKVVNYQ